MKLNNDDKNEKGFRLLYMHERLKRGEGISKESLTDYYNVSERTIRRDMDDLRAYLTRTCPQVDENPIKYNIKDNLYYLDSSLRGWLNNKEVLAIAKILLESRAFEKGELDEMIEKLFIQLSHDERKHIEELIKNERHHYVPLKHGKKLLDLIWDLSHYISRQQIIYFSYTRQDGEQNIHKVHPVAIMFSEYYFYLISFMSDNSKDYPTLFRIDRMKDITGTDKKFKIRNNNQFDDGEFRKRVQFMYSGELRRVMFEYSGASIEAVLDRLPTAQVLSEKDGVYTVRAEVYGSGIDMWLKSQGDSVKIIQE